MWEKLMENIAVKDWVKKRSFQTVTKKTVYESKKLSAFYFTILFVSY